MFVPEDHTGCGARPIPAARRNRTSADALRLARPTARTGTLLTHDTRRVREAVKLGYDLRAPEFGKGATRRHRAHRMAVPEVAHGARVLDVGAGTGRSTAPVIEQNSAAVVIGLDLSAAMLRRALDSFRGRVGWVQGDAERLPLADRSFDLVVSRRALSHLPDPCEAFREIARVLPGRAMYELPMDHPVFNGVYDITEIMQVPNLTNGWRHGLYGTPTDEGRGSEVPHVFGIDDDEGHTMVIINWNTDLGDAWEWAEHPYYPLKFSTYAFEMGINMIVYGMSH